MPDKSHVRITNETVIKTGDPILMRIEVEKTRRACQIGKDCQLFRVPEVLDFDEKRGIAVFKRIPGIKPLYRSVPWGRQYSEFGERVGTALAVIHRNLTLLPDMIYPLPPEFRTAGQDVFLHGDPSVFNICLDPSSYSIVILDWQMTYLHGGQATYGCRYFDIFWFVNNLLWAPTIRHLLGDPIGPVARSFIESYYLQAKIPYEAERISDYAEGFFATKLPLRLRNSRRDIIFFPRSNTLTQRFIRSLRKERFHE